MEDKTLLWLDDLRNPYLDWEDKVPENLKLSNIIWVRNFEEFSDFIKRWGIPNYISFDHDLADTHYTPEKYWSDYELSKTYQDIQIHEEKTGLDCLKFLINTILDNPTEKLPIIYSHSANPVGKDNIENLWKNFNKFKNKL